MGKTWIYLAVVAILGLGVYFLLFRENNGLYSERDANFTVSDTAAIGKVFLVQSDGSSILLERKPSGWIVNNKYEVIPIQIVNLLTCLKMQTALTPVAKREHDAVIQMLAALATKVEVYDKTGKKIRVFYVAGQGPNYHGSYMLMEGAEQPYLVEVPGFGGYLTPRFTTDINDWRARLIFNLPPDSIRSVKVDYDGEPLSSFEVINQDKQLTVKADPQVQPVLKDLNEPKTKAYLDFFKNVYCEGYANGAEDIDSLISHTQRRCRLSVTSAAGKQKSLDIYWMDITRRSKSSLQPQTISDPSNRPKDVDRLYAIDLNAHDTMIIQSVTFDKILRRSYEFYTPDEDSAKINRQRFLRPAPLSPHGHISKS